MEIKRTKGITSKRIDGGIVYKFKPSKYPSKHPLFKVLYDLRAENSFWRQVGEIDLKEVLGLYKNSKQEVYLVNRSSIYKMEKETLCELYLGDKRNYINHLVKQVPATKGDGVLEAYSELDRAW
jgi:hypothetical protein